jgi:hypothetical protein
MKVKTAEHVARMDEARNTELFIGKFYVKGLLQGRIIFEWISQELTMKRRVQSA